MYRKNDWSRPKPKPEIHAVWVCLGMILVPIVVALALARLLGPFSGPLDYGPMMPFMLGP